MERLSDITSYRYGSHQQSDGRYATGVALHTDTTMLWKGEHYGSRFDGHLSRGQLLVEEQRFVARREGRSP